MQHLHIQRVTYVRDLGVTLTQTLSSDMHVQDICARANQFQDLSEQVLKFSAVVWSPYHTGLISDLQKIQDKFVRVVGVRQGMNYLEVPVNLMSKELQLSPLVVRRKLQDALFLFKRLIFVCHPVQDLKSCSGRNHHPTSYDWNCSLVRIQRVGCAISRSVDFFSSSLPAFRKKVMKILSEE
ncbi:hypothetical protein J6590_033077 [Homalodisca vitripennis]|nr:hypothetical protein J6590_033077 [Homalodisca vitripennis]